MTDAKFCDVHPDQATSLIRVQSGQRSFYTITLSYDTKEKGHDGKMIKWTVDSGKIHVCAKCALDLILNRMKGLGVDVEWKDAYRLTQKDGKYTRIVKGDKPLEEPIEQ